jgi:hypothetical protein
VLVFYVIDKFEVREREGGELGSGRLMEAGDDEGTHKVRGVE